ncbi:MAG: hypothetical protein II857_12785 [Selenomonadaceae bacterium]|nr:hypothetical protein [Selenomonadaceae bacterium]
MKLKNFFAIIIFILAIGKISFAQSIENISVNLDDKESCKNYIAAVCAETVKLLSEKNLPPAPDYDLLCRAVEKFSDGKNVVILDEVGYPSIMVKIPAFKIAAGVHPMFTVKGKNYSCVYFSKYENIIFHGRAYSLPNVEPSTNIDMDTARRVCSVKGRGWHLASNIEYSGIALLCHKHGFYPHGNTNTDISENFYPNEHGRVVEEKRAPDGKILIRKTATGSGPVTWAHDGTAHGIYDLNGNVWEMAEGIRLVNGEIQILLDNDGVLPECRNDWKAIDKRGNLVKVGSKNTLKFDSTKGDSSSKFRLIEGATLFLSLQRKISMYQPEDTNRNFGYVTCKFKDLRADKNLNVPAILRLHSVFPFEDKKNLPDDGFLVRNYGIRRIMKGGMWGHSAGLFGASFAGAWNDSSPGMGFRSAFIDLEER